MQKKFKSEEPLGTGAIEGIAASEAANTQLRQARSLRCLPLVSQDPVPARFFWADL